MRSLRPALVITALLTGALAGQSPRRADPVPFTRLAAYTLEVDEPGVAVIRDSAAWWTLWRYFGREYRSGGAAGRLDSIATPPRVDFDHDMVVAVRGPAFGCAGGSYINRMESDGSRLRVGRGPHPSRVAQELLFQRHADALANNPRADTATLALVIDGLRGGD